MVVGHSGCPTYICRFIYLFHMPLFFVCSGFFFKDIIKGSSLVVFFKKRIKGLYLPYFKWSLLFLLLHNTFCRLDITHDIIYQSDDYIKQFIKLIIMTDYELLIRPFWFIKELLFASIIVAIISLFRSRFFPKISTESILIFFVTSSILAKYAPVIPFIGDCSILFLSVSYYYSGILLNKYHDSFPIKYPTLLLLFIIILFGSLLFPGLADMRYTTVYNRLLYFILSIIGILMIFCISKMIDNKHNCSILYYIGNHTMPILALNLLTLKLGNLIKIWFYNLPTDRLSSHTVIYDNNLFFWLIYTAIGVTVPIFIYFMYSTFALRFIPNRNKSEDSKRSGTDTKKSKD